MLRLWTVTSILFTFCLHFVGICFVPVFLSLLFYREDIDILYTFQVVLRVYFTDIVCTFYRHYVKPFFFCTLHWHFLQSFRWNEDFIDILSYLFYKVFFLAYFTRIMFTIKKVFPLRFTALFTNMRTLKFKSRLHNCVFRSRQS